MTNRLQPPYAPGVLFNNSLVKREIFCQGLDIAMESSGAQPRLRGCTLPVQPGSPVVALLLSVNFRALLCLEITRKPELLAR